MRASGLPHEEIAGYTARWHSQNVPSMFAPKALVGEPLGAAGIPTTKLPGLAANFGKNGTVYVIQIPKNGAIKVPQWGLSVENEWIILNQIPDEFIIQTLPATRLPAAVRANKSGHLVLTR